MTFDVGFIKDTLPLVLKACPTTLLVTLFPAVVGAVIGLFNALSRMNNVLIAKQVFIVTNVYIRGVPLFVQLFIGFYGFPKIINGIFFSGVSVFNSDTIPPIVTALVVFTVYANVYLSEIIRGGLLSVDMQQVEAAYSIGMTKTQAFIRIVIPQAFVVVLPNYFNFVMALLKNSSLVFGILVMDMMAIAKIEAEAGYRYIEAYVMLVVIYVLLGYIFYRTFGAIENVVKKRMGGMLDAHPAN